MTCLVFKYLRTASTISKGLSSVRHCCSASEKCRDVGRYILYSRYETVVLGQANIYRLHLLSYGGVVDIQVYRM